MSNLVNLVYAVKDGRMVHIRDVGNGSACGCVCPECGENLIARQGDVRAWHFAHVSGAECVSAPETALHKFAKQWLASQDGFVIPAVVGCCGRKCVKLSRSRFSVVGQAFVEKSFGIVVPDVYVEFLDGSRLFLEVLVTHAVDCEKREKLSGIGIPTLELDLSDVDRDIPPDDLVPILRDALRSAVWSYHPDIEKFAEACREEDRRKAEARREKMRAGSEERKRRHDEANAAVMAAQEVVLKPAAESVPGPDSDVIGRRDALAAVYAKIEADKNARAEAERQARIQEVEADRAAYLAKDAIGRLLHHPRCLACGGDLKHETHLGELDEDEYFCTECGRIWHLNRMKMTFDLCAGRICPDCEFDMVQRHGRNGFFWGCVIFPRCRRTFPVD